MADLQELICWDDIATVFQISHQPTTRSTYGSAQITRMLAVGLLSPGTLQTQVWCLLIVCSLFFNYLLYYKLYFYAISTYIVCKINSFYRCVSALHLSIHLSVLNSVYCCVPVSEYVYLYVHVHMHSCLNVDHCCWY
jgi:hypothetical protein